MQPATSSFDHAIKSLTYTLDSMQLYSTWVGAPDDNLRFLIDRIVRIKSTLAIPPNEQSKAALQQLLPQCKWALNEKMKFFMPLPANARNKDLQIKNTRMQGLQKELETHFDDLFATVSSLPVVVVSPPDQMSMEVERSAAWKQDKTSEKRMPSVVASAQATSDSMPCEPVAPGLSKRRNDNKNDLSNKKSKFPDPDLDSLPNEMIDRCIRFLPLSDLVRMRLFSRKFKHIVDQFFHTFDGLVKQFCEVKKSQNIEKQKTINELRSQWLQKILVHPKLNAHLEDQANSKRFFEVLSYEDWENLPLDQGKSLLRLLFQYADDNQLHRFVRKVFASGNFLVPSTGITDSSTELMKMFMHVFLEGENGSKIERLLTMDPDIILPLWVVAGNMKVSYEYERKEEQNYNLFLTILRFYQRYPDALIWNKMWHWTFLFPTVDVKAQQLVRELRPHPICADLLAARICSELQKDYKSDLKQRMISMLEFKCAARIEDLTFRVVEKISSQFEGIPERQKLAFALAIHHFRRLIKIDPKIEYRWIEDLNLDTVSRYEFKMFANIPDDRIDAMMEYVHSSMKSSEGGHFRAAFQYVRENCPECLGDPKTGPFARKP